LAAQAEEDARRKERAASLALSGKQEVETTTEDENE